MASPFTGVSRQPSTVKSFFAENSFENAFALAAAGCFSTGKKRHADGVLARLGQSEAQRRALAGKKFVRNLNQQAGAVAGLRIATAGAAMGQVDQDLNALLNDLVALLAANAGDKPHAAGVVLMRRVIKTLRRRQAVICLPALQKQSPGKGWRRVVGRQSPVLVQ